MLYLQEEFNCFVVKVLVYVLQSIGGTMQSLPELPEISPSKDYKKNGLTLPGLTEMLQVDTHRPY